MAGVVVTSYPYTDIDGWDGYTQQDGEEGITEGAI